MNILIQVYGVRTASRRTESPNALLQAIAEVKFFYGSSSKEVS
jgi:hypothetical protein